MTPLKRIKGKEKNRKKNEMKRGQRIRGRNKIKGIKLE